MAMDGERSYNHNGSDLPRGESPYVSPVVIVVNCGDKSAPVRAANLTASPQDIRTEYGARHHANKQYLWFDEGLHEKKMIRISIKEHPQHSAPCTNRRQFGSISSAMLGRPAVAGRC